MRNPDQARRSRVLASLAGFVVVFGVSAWLITGGIGFHGATPTYSHPATFTPAPTLTPAPTPTPLVCASNGLGLTGAINTCATAAPDKTSTCSVSRNVLDAVLRFAGGNQVIVLYIEINAGFYTGPGKYYFAPWQFRLGRNDLPKAAVLQSTGRFWESVAGVVNVAGNDGRSGNVNAILQASSVGVQASDGQTVVPGPTLSVVGTWTCP